MAKVTSISIKDEYIQDFNYLTTLGNKSQLICLLVHAFCLAHKKEEAKNQFASSPIEQPVLSPIDTLKTTTELENSGYQTLIQASLLKIFED